MWLPAIAGAMAWLRDAEARARLSVIRRKTRESSKGFIATSGPEPADGYAVIVCVAAVTDQSG